MLVFHNSYVLLSYFEGAEVIEFITTLDAYLSLSNLF